MTTLSRAGIAIILSKLKRFEKPKTALEQYPTPSEAAATILWDAYIHDLIVGKHVIDLGAGTGILGIGALFLGARKVTFLELDEDAAATLQENHAAVNAEYVLTGESEIIIGDGTKSTVTGDLVIMNPPFGTKKLHADTDFLAAAVRMAPRIYSFHKEATDAHIEAQAKLHGLHPVQKFPFTFNLAPTMSHHEKHRHLVTITCWHLAR
jgi:predicted RNA methylase